MLNNASALICGSRLLFPDKYGLEQKKENKIPQNILLYGLLR